MTPRQTTIVGTLLLIFGTLGIWAQQPAKEAPKVEAKANPNEKPFSPEAKSKIVSIVNRSNSLQAELAKLQTEAQKLIIAEQEKLQGEADAVIKSECSAAGFPGEECQPDIRALVMRRVPKPAEKK